MFWKRKSKKKDGQEATGSAEEAAGPTEGVEEIEEDSEAAKPRGAQTVGKDGEADGGEAAEGGETAKAEEKETADETDEAEGAGKTAEDKGSDDEDPAGKAGDGETAEDPDEETGDAEDSDDKASDEDTGDGDTDTDEDTEAEDSDDKGSSTDVFADEGEEAGVTGPDSDGITRVRTAGTFEFDGEKYDVVSNTWIIEADEDGVVVIDPGHDPEVILEAIGERDIYLVACTNGYSPHIESAIAVAEEAEAPIALHPREMRTWRRFHGAEHRPEIEVEGEGSLDVGDLHIDVLALPGTSPGTVGYYISQKGVVFSGDTVRAGEPGMVGDTYIDYTTQLASIGEKLLSLPPTTRLLPDRGPATTSAAEGANFDSWV